MNSSNAINVNNKLRLIRCIRKRKYKINYTINKYVFFDHDMGAVFSMIKALAKLRAHAKRIKSKISSIFSTR